MKRGIMITDLKVNEKNKKEYYEKGYWTERTLNDIWNTQVAAFPDREYVSDNLGVRRNRRQSIAPGSLAPRSWREKR